jgi:lipoprotein-anchoring transpeptidase ErfK/SrfK
MSRSRAALLAAWGLLAVGTAVEFVRADVATPATAATIDVAAHRDPDRLAATGRAVDPTPAPAPPRIVLPDDPANWPDVVVAPVARVATVIGNGVASLTGPGGGHPVHWFPNPTQFGGPRTFLVVDDHSSPDYVKVSLPVMPNGQEGWLARSEIELSTVSTRAEVDLSEATVTVWDGPEIVATTRAVTGRPATPTPLGRFYVRDVIAQADPDGGYGPWILALSGFSEVLTSFDGGLPALALHGTDRPEEVGSALSSGCVRVPNDVISLLAEIVPVGTPVTVVA